LAYRFTRGEIIVVFRALVTGVAIEVYQVQRILRLPHELFRTRDSLDEVVMQDL
jgi:hypothetical protein